MNLQKLTQNSINALNNAERISAEYSHATINQMHLLLALLLQVNGLIPSLLRKNDVAYKKLDMENNNYSETQILDFMVEDPNLVQRPIIEKGEKAIGGRPIEKINELF